MNLTRRSLFTGALALVAAAAVGRAASAEQFFSPDPTGMPVLWADGIHDDTAALQALIDGKSYFDNRTGKVATAQVVGTHGAVLPKGEFFLAGTLVIGPHVAGLDGNNSPLNAMPGSKGPLLRFHERVTGWITNIHVAPGSKRGRAIRYLT